VHEEREEEGRLDSVERARSSSSQSSSIQSNLSVGNAMQFGEMMNNVTRQQVNIIYG